MGSARTELDRRVLALRAERLRVGSLVITFFGDAVVPRGGEVWLGTIARLLDRLEVPPGTLGAAMSRLTAEGWLSRHKRGRHSHYRLAEGRREAFEAAARRVYGLEEPTWTGTYTLLFSSGDAAARAAGFGRIEDGIFVRAEEDPPHPVPLPAGATGFSAVPLKGSNLAALVRRAFDLDAADHRSARFVAEFSPLSEALARSAEAGAAIEPEDAMLARTLLVHGFRRLVLEDPRLPPEAEGPPAGPRAEARRLVRRAYAALLAPSEAWLDQVRDLSPPDDAFFQRFGGLPSTRLEPQRAAADPKPGACSAPDPRTEEPLRKKA